MIHNRKLSTKKLSELDPYSILKSNIEYTDVKRPAYDEKTISGEDSYGSEKSYDQLITNTEFWDFVTFLTVTSLWNYAAAVSNLILYCITTYSMVFNDGVHDAAVIIVAKVVCNLVIIADVLLAFLHYSRNGAKQRSVILPRRLTLQTLDLLTLSSVFVSFSASLRENAIVRPIMLLAISIRLYRILSYYSLVTTTAGMNTKSYLLLKHGLIFVFFIHSFACLWMYEAQTKENKQLTNTWLKESPLSSVISAQLHRNGSTTESAKAYILSLLYVAGGITSVALGGGSALQNEEEKALLLCLMLISLQNEEEKALLLCLMLISFFYLNGLCLGTFTSVQVEKYRRQTQFINKFKLILSNLGSHNISKSLRSKMLKYYIQFWRQQDAINYSALFVGLPMAIRQQVLLDKFWYAIDEIHIFKNLHASFKRHLACYMTARICIPGEIIYSVENIRDCMTYITKGSVTLLSTVDGESPLITFGSGTSLGKVNLVYSMKNPTKVVAATYCTIYVLEKRILWKEISKYRQLQQSHMLHANIQRILQVARRLHKEKEEARERQHTSLQRTKRMLRIENEHQSIDYTLQDTTDKKNELSYIYVLCKRSNMYSDGIFVHTTWPWILNTESAFLSAWEIIVVLVVLTSCIGYPYEIAFSRSFSNDYVLYRVLGDIVYFIDVIFKLFTAIESDHGMLTTLVEISLNRLSQLSFICDLLAVFPLYAIASYTLHKEERYLILLSLSKLLKFYRIISYLQKLEYNFKLNIASVRMLKYVLFLLYPGYLVGCLYYMVLCFKTPCDQKMALANKTQNSISYSIMTAMLIMSGTGGIVEFYTIEEVSLILCVSISGTLTIVYLVGDYSATLTLAEREITMYMEMINVMRKFMITNHMVKHLQVRMNQYLIARWLDCKGMNYKDLYRDAPKQLFEEFQVKKYSKILYTNQIFHHLHVKIIKKLATSCQSVSLPPNEYVCYAGEVSREMYIIEHGYCEVISASSEKVDKILGPMSGFCMIETLLELAGIFNIRTITHVTLLKLALTSIKEAMLLVPEVAEQLTTLSAETKNSFAVRRLFTISSSEISQVSTEEKNDSWVVFPNSIVDPRYIDFHNGWTKFALIKYFMLSRTIQPYGQFILIWEIVRAFFAYASAMIFPVLHIYQFYVSNLNYYVLILDGFGLIDMYIRMHVCYYNKLGILVTHPRQTAKNYVCSSFVIDLLALLPTDYIILAVERQNITAFNRLQCFVRFNRVLQVYRLPDAFSIFSRDPLKRRGVYVTAIKFVLLTSVVMNSFAAIIVNLSVEVNNLENGLKNVTPSNDSWILIYKQSFTLDVYEPINIYVMAYYWVTTTTLQLSYGSINAGRDQEVIFIIVVIVAGYLWYNYVIVIISNSKATINAHLTLYQNHMKRLIEFMKQEKISKELQKKAIDHFEYIWQRTHGMDASNILRQCHVALRKDCALYLYEDTLKLVTVFADMLPSFYRMLGTAVNENYYLKNYPILQLNDIVKYVYIIHKGEVLVIGPDGSYFATLTRGCMFGNLDDIKHTRSMVTILSSTNVDLLTVPTEIFYYRLRDYPVVRNRIQKHILLENLSYMQTKLVKSEEQSANTIGFIFQDCKEEDHETTNAFDNSISLCCSIQDAGFALKTIIVLGISYTLDVAYVCHVYIGFQTSHSTYALDSEQTHHKKRHITFSNCIDVASILPLELLAIFASTEQQTNIFYILRMNRACRLWNIYHFFNISYNFLNINVLAIKVASILTTMSTILHTETCIWYMIGKDNEDGWMYGTNRTTTCVNTYLCSLYFSVSLTSFSGYMNTRPRTVIELVILIFNTIVNKFIAAVVIGDMSSITKSSSSTLMNFDYSRGKMELFLKHSYISMPLFKGVMLYTSQLWHKSQGYQIPIFITQAPGYISASIKWAAYGHHIRDNWVFMDTHTDFIRLLIKKLQLHVYFPGDTICQQGDVNSTMYFIHSGNVNAFYITETEEIHVDSLDQNDCFGMIQGLFPNTPHTHTFKAVNVTSIIMLNLKTWIHMLQFYPGSKFLIYDRISKLDSCIGGI
ncbi:Cyclic nucleotide-binding domain [Popillia japonica]|uniref:Cyclic nucleotide-binding domain n=1 Tax=Popillia japonica TaxID=7064 RepID=A0AAW1MJ65_POPJA